MSGGAAPAVLAPDPRPLVFVDLDDTLFATRRKRPQGEHPAALDVAGAPLSFQTARQRAFWAWLQAGAAQVIPVTGRSTQALGRVTLGLPTAWAVCSFGAIILQDGVPHAAWAQALGDDCAPLADALPALARMATAQAGDLAARLRIEIVEDGGLPLYLVIKHRDHDVAALTALRATLVRHLPEGWRATQNDNNLALLPRALGKARAVAWLLERLAPAAFTIGIGDSLSDLGFMGLCDFAMAPADSQILATLGRGGEP